MKGQDDQTASPCKISWQSVKPSQRYGDFSIFQNGGRLPSFICYAGVCTTHKGHLVVFITCKIWLESMQ